MQELKEYFQNRKNLSNLIVLLVLVLALPLGIFLAKNRQIFFSSADRGAPIELGDGPCVTDKENKKINCKEIPLKLISPLGPPVGASQSASPSPSASATSSASPSATASASPSACNPKKFDENIWSKKLETCEKGKQRVIFTCQDKTKTKKQKCDPVIPNSSPIPQSAFNGPHNIPGKIEAEDFDNGGEGVAYHLEKRKNNNYRKNEDVDIFKSKDTYKVGYNINLYAKEWAEYTFNVSSQGVYKLEIKMSSKDGGKFHIEIDGQDKTGQIIIPENKNFIILSKDGISLDQGEHIMRFVVDETSKNNPVGDINYFEFKSAPTANLFQNIQNFLTGKVFADASDEDPGGSSTDSAKVKKCSNSLIKKGLCPSVQPSPSPEPNCNDKKDNDNDGKIDIEDPDCHTDGNAGNKKSYDKKRNESRIQASPSTSATASASERPGGSGITESYRISDSESGLSSAEFKPYDEEPIITNFTLPDNNPGPKQIWVEFKPTEGLPQKEHITLTMASKDPKISSFSCTVDIAKQNLKVEVAGQDLGEQTGKITSDGNAIDILEWKKNSVTGILKKPSLPTDDTQTFKIKLTRNDGIATEEIPCRVDTSLISLGAKVFCRQEGQFDVANVKVTIKDQTDNKTDEAVTIDKNGAIQGLKTKLQSGKRYLISIKAPNSLRRNAFFTASIGTSIVTADDGSTFILPIGDIAPANAPDGVINSADRAILTRQWIASKTSTKNLTGDFNRDLRVNSFDWACMRYDFGKNDDKKADQISLSCGKPPVCNGNLLTGDPSPNDPLQCPQYSCETNTQE